MKVEKGELKEEMVVDSDPLSPMKLETTVDRDDRPVSGV